MNSRSVVDVSLKDPLSANTRAERKLLLISSVASIFIAKTGLVPTKVSALGIELQNTNQAAFLVITALVVAYFLVAFFLYGLTDLIAWRIEYKASARQLHRAFLQRIQRPLEHGMDRNDEPTPEHLSSSRARWLALRMSLLRGLFEFALPVGVGSYAIWLLLAEARRIAP